MKKWMLLSVIVIGLFSCQRGWYVIPDKDITDENKSEALMYCLPRTSLEIELVVNEHHYIPGPYSSFAESYLNISGVEQQEKYFWSLAGVDLNSVTESDPNAVFWLFPGKTTPVLSYAGQLRLLAVNAGLSESDGEPEARFFRVDQSFPDELPFTDLGVKRNKYEVIDTTWRVIEKDSVIQRIPVYKSVEREKNWHHKAQDAANYIIKIRKRRFKLEAAIDEQQTEGDGVEVMIRKLEELEESYLDLFVGKTFTETKTYYFRVTPEAFPENQRFVLANMDIEDGEPQEDMTETLPLILEVSTLTNIQIEYPEPEKPEQAGLYVRNAGDASCKLYLGDDLVFESMAMIPQLYPVRYIDSKLFNEKSKVYLNSKSGNLKMIE